MGVGWRLRSKGFLSVVCEVSSRTCCEQWDIAWLEGRIKGTKIRLIRTAIEGNRKFMSISYVSKLIARIAILFISSVHSILLLNLDLNALIISFVSAFTKSASVICLGFLSPVNNLTL